MEAADPIGASVVVGTAGHIDHGKTTMVRSLTGIDCDTLPEEKARGITIALGFAPMVLPDGRRVAFVDVPGHERLVRTMVAGATGVDAVLLCVSASEGVKPQTREHLAILGILGVRDGAVVLTMADLVDDELLELARLDASELVAGTFLEGKPIIAFSAITGRGKDELIGVLGTFGRRERAAGGAYRMPIDRAFVRPGFGTVVTGTSWSGRIDDGDAVVLLPEGIEARVRGIQVHGVPSDLAKAGWRTALNLAGIERDDVDRGNVVTRGGVPSASMIDVRYHHLPGAPPLSDGDSVRMLHGTAERIGRLYLAEERDDVPPGASVWAQIRLDAPLPCLPRDRFVLRRPSPQETLGGGEIVDPWAPKLRNKDRARWTEWLRRLAKGDVVAWLERAGEEGLSPDEWAARTSSIDAGGGAAVALGDRLYAPTVIARLQGVLLEQIQHFHAEHPLARGANRRELHRDRLAHLSEKAFDALVDALVAANAVQIDGPMLRASAFRVSLGDAEKALKKRIVESFQAAGLEGLAVKAIHEKHKEPETASIVALLESDGRVEQVAGLGYVWKAALEDLVDQVRGWFATHPELTPGDFKELTGLSRKAAIPLLEWLDKARHTRRVGDARIRGTAAV
jgi:selenocysteine-specific elongation factor